MAAGMMIAGAGAAERNLPALQKEYLSWRFGLFLHFNMASFSPAEWANGREDPADFNPDRLDFGQWADAAAAAHMGYAILTVKHTGGWCLWPSDVTDHDVSQFKNCRNGRGDLVREFCEAFRRRGLKVGFYYCFPLWGKEWADYWTLPIKGYETDQTDSLDFVKKQFTELLTRYGKIDLLWVDQYGSTNGGLEPGDWEKIKAHVHALQPGCLVIANNSHDFRATDIYGYEYPYSLTLPPPDNTIPSEVCDKLQGGWFNNPEGSPRPLRDVQYLVHRMLLPMNARHANYLLNCAPDEHGRLPDSVVALLRAVGREWNPATPPGTLDERSHLIQTAVREVPNEQNLVALIFDPAADPAGIETPATWLAQHDARATCFLTAAAFDAAPEKIRALVAQGHEIGNGSKSGKDLTPIKSGLDIRSEVETVQQKARGLLHAPPLVFRAPGDAYAGPIWDALNYFDLIPVAPAVTIAPGSSRATWAKAIKSGSLIALKKGISEAQLSALLAVLREKGLKPVPLHELLLQARTPWLREFAQACWKNPR